VYTQLIQNHKVDTTMNLLSKHSNWLLPFTAVILGLLSGLASDFAPILASADAISTLFINLLKLVSLPIIFLSVVSTATGMDSLEAVKSLGKRVVTYTLLTTIIAAFFALGIYLVVDPTGSHLAGAPLVTTEVTGKNYISYLIDIVPSNVIRPFIEGNVTGVLFMAIIISLAILSLPKKNKDPLHQLFSSLFAAVMKITSTIVKFMPIAIWSFVTLFVRDVKAGLEMESLAWYLFCILLANLVQAVVVLPLLLKAKGISPLKTAQGMLPALSVAFFSKSSSAALPMAMECAEKRVGVSRNVARFTLPLCTTINMNACAAFILTTVLFVSTSHGVTFTPVELILWAFIATIAAVGNAGVPMGCYFLASALLASMNVPLNILGVILPFYTLIDMFESAVNVWSDSCVATVVDKDLQAEEEVSLAEALVKA
jgi:Na+/H+-dicarboxylate symporter